jgi:hypothetical protein
VSKVGEKICNEHLGLYRGARPVEIPDAIAVDAVEGENLIDMERIPQGVTRILETKMYRLPEYQVLILGVM